jgi:hypothetical protein
MRRDELTVRAPRSANEEDAAPAPQAEARSSSVQEAGLATWSLE